MKILITGAAGFLGRHFAAFHFGRNDTVHGIDDLSSPHATWGPGNNIAGDAGSFFDGWDDAIRNDYDLVYHFAAPVGGREKIEGDPLFNAGSLRLDASLFRWASTHGRGSVIVYPSSSAVYPTWMQEKAAVTPLREDDFHPEDTQWGAPDEVYGLSKMVGEVLAWKAATYGVNTLCIRPFSGYGEDQSQEYPVPSIARRAARKEDPLIVWGSGQQARDFIHVDDLVRATVSRVDYGVYGFNAMNICTGEFHTFNQIAAMCAREAGYEPTIENLEGKPQGVSKRFGDPSRMLEYWRPEVMLQEGLRRVVEAQG